MISSVAERMRGEIQERFARLSLQDRLALVLDLGRHEAGGRPSARAKRD